jgi:hypothetical protein
MELFAFEIYLIEQVLGLIYILQCFFFILLGNNGIDHTKIAFDLSYYQRFLA